MLLRLQLPVILLLLTGCAPHTPQKTHVAPVSHHENFQISLEVAPTPLKQMDKETFMVHLADAKGKPLPGASVQAQLAMPSMDMGDNIVTLKERFPGIYIGTGRFTMNGDWTVTVTGAQGKISDSKVFPFSVQ